MKKILFLILIVLLSTKLHANTKIVKNTYYEGEIKFYHLKYELPKGKWLAMGRYTDNIDEYPNIGSTCINFAQLEGKIYKSGLSICEVHTTGSYTGYVGMYLNKVLISGEHDSCTLRPEYFYTKLWTKGMSSNCFLVRHIDVHKELNYPDDPDTTNAFIKRWIRENDVTLPATLLSAEHLYYSPNVRDKGYEVTYLINPELFGAPKTLNGDENMSEYNRNNISKFPKKNKFMNNWTKKAAKKHQEFEDHLTAKPNHRLNFEDLSLNSFATNNDNDNVVKELIELKKLLETGVINDNEFEKAKKKILN